MDMDLVCFVRSYDILEIIYEDFGASSRYLGKG